MSISSDNGQKGKKDSVSVSLSTSSNTFLTSEESYVRFDSGICLSYQSDTTSATSIRNHSDVAEGINKLSLYSDASNTENFNFQQNKDGDTPLHMAIIKYDQELFTQIIDQNPPKIYLDVQNYEFYQTPLHLAVETEMTSMIDTLVALGVSTYLKDKNGNTPLHAACLKGDFHSITRLMMFRDKWEDNRSNHQHRSLEKIIPLNVKTHDDELSSLNYDGKTCLHLALETPGLNKMRIIKFLVCQCGANINMPEGKSGYTILHEVVRRGDTETLDQILTLPIPVSAPPLFINPLNFQGMTPLDMALRLPNLKVQSLLTSAGGVKRSFDGGDDNDDGVGFFDTSSLSSSSSSTSSSSQTGTS